MSVMFWLGFEWSLSFYVSVAMLWACERKEFMAEPDKATRAFFFVMACVPGISPVSALIIWLLHGCPRPDFDWPARMPGLRKAANDATPKVDVAVTPIPLIYGGSRMPGTSPAQLPAPAQAEENTLGWRAWHWDVEAKELLSPVQGTRWETAELRCEAWDENATVRGYAGIHAALVPPNWAMASNHREVPAPHAFIAHTAEGCRFRVVVTGIVERFGRYVLGEGGWRAEWVIIRKLLAPTQEIGLQLEATFPEVEVIYL